MLDIRAREICVARHKIGWIFTGRFDYVEKCNRRGALQRREAFTRLPIRWAALGLLWMKGQNGKGSVPRRLAEVAAVILTAEKLAGFGIDSDALAVGPVPVADCKRISHGAESSDGVSTESWFEVELVG